MEDVVEQLKEVSAGMTPDEVLAVLSEQCPAVPPDKVEALASWICSLNAA